MMNLRKIKEYNQKLLTTISTWKLDFYHEKQYIFDTNMKPVINKI